MLAVGTSLTSPPHRCTDSVDHGKPCEAAQFSCKYATLVDAVRDSAHKRPRDGNERCGIRWQTGHHCGSEKPASLDRSAVFEVVDETHGGTNMKEPRLNVGVTDLGGRYPLKRVDTRVAERPSGHCTRETEHGVNVSTGYDTRSRLWSHTEPAAEFRFPVLGRDRSLGPLAVDSELDAFLEQRHTIRPALEESGRKTFLGPRQA